MSKKRRPKISQALVKAATAMDDNVLPPQGAEADAHDAWMKLPPEERRAQIIKTAAEMVKEAKAALPLERRGILGRKWNNRAAAYITASQDMEAQARFTDRDRLADLSDLFSRAGRALIPKHIIDAN